MYRIVLSERAKKDYNYWLKRGDGAIIRRIVALLGELREHPFSGMGKPEALRYNLSGYWSRRINGEHRLIYKVRDAEVEVDVLAMRYHYDK